MFIPQSSENMGTDYVFSDWHTKMSKKDNIVQILFVFFSKFPKLMVETISLIFFGHILFNFTSETGLHWNAFGMPKFNV